MKFTEVAVIIPVYNEARVIADIIKNTKKTFPNIICVNDGSTDMSAKIIRGEGVRLVNHPINMGQGAALQTGIEYARNMAGIKYFVTFDADGQHRVEDVKKMLENIEETGVDIVMGSRFLGRAENISKVKKIILKLAIKFSNLTSGIRLTDTHNGLRVFNRKVAEKMQITMSDMAHASEILEIIRENKFNYSEVPVTIVYTEYSKSKGQSVLNAINIAFDILLMRISR